MSPVPRDLRGHSLREVLSALARVDAEGELSCVDSSGRRHRLLLRGGRLVAVHVEGRFDPLLARLRRSGVLDEAAHRRALEALASSERRAGELARREGADPRAIDEAVDRQQTAALEALARRVDGTSARLAFEPRVVVAREVVSWRRPAHRAPCATSEPPTRRAPGSTSEPPTRRAPGSTSEPPTHGAPRSTADPRRAPRAAPLVEPPPAMDRATFRRLVRELHPDLHGHLPADERARRAARLAELTARHGRDRRAPGR
ncbi:MAG: hypothetical protein KF901_07585 [Myxococcales bacterium]|nr:hypothetical protein [Myxococcales bacterium]